MCLPYVLKISSLENHLLQYLNCFLKGKDLFKNDYIAKASNECIGYLRVERVQNVFVVEMDGINAFKTRGNNWIE